mgnify:CR=1 FL=1
MHLNVIIRTVLFIWHAGALTCAVSHLIDVGPELLCRPNLERSGHIDCGVVGCEAAPMTQVADWAVERVGHLLGCAGLVGLGLLVVGIVLALAAVVWERAHFLDAVEDLSIRAVLLIGLILSLLFCHPRQRRLVVNVLWRLFWFYIVG